MEIIWMRLNLIILLVVMSVVAWGQEPRKVRVIYHEFKPCIFEKANGSIDGYEHDVMSEISKVNGWEIEWIKAASFKDIFNQIDSGDADLAVSGISITSERLQKYDFSIPHLESGLRLMTLKKDDGGGESAYYLAYIVTNIAVYTFLGFIILFGHIVWLSERGEDEFNDNYFPGVFEAMYFTLVTMTTVGYGDYAPKRWQGRIVTTCLIIAGIIFFGWFASEITNIPDYETKLPEKNELSSMRIGTMRDTTGEEWLRNTMLPAEPKMRPTINECYADLIMGNVDAVLFDSPAIIHYAKTEGRGKVRYGKLYNREYYGFMMKKDSPLADDMNGVIISVSQSMQEKWFGKNE